MANGASQGPWREARGDACVCCASRMHREQQVMDLVASGSLLNKQVGGELGHQRDHGEGAP